MTNVNTLHLPGEFSSLRIGDYRGQTAFDTLALPDPSKKISVVDYTLPQVSHMLRKSSSTGQQPIPLEPNTQYFAVPQMFTETNAAPISSVNNVVLLIGEHGPMINASPISNLSVTDPNIGKNTQEVACAIMFDMSNHMAVNFSAVSPKEGKQVNILAGGPAPGGHSVTLLDGTIGHQEISMHPTYIAPTFQIGTAQRRILQLPGGGGIELVTLDHEYTCAQPQGAKEEFNIKPLFLLAYHPPKSSA